MTTEDKQDRVGMVASRPPKRGEVVLVALDPTRGSEIRKTRPCVVVSPDELNAHLRTVIVAPLSTGGQKYPFRVRCRFASRSGEVVVDQLRTIDRELAMAQQIGFNCVRVFLHNIPWEQDRRGFSKRVDKFLEAADRHRIRVKFVLLDSCWDPYPKVGPQRPPTPGLHNSGWVQCPGVEILKDPSRHVAWSDAGTGRTALSFSRGSAPFTTRR